MYMSLYVRSLESAWDTRFTRAFWRRPVSFEPRTLVLSAKTVPDA
jgi:hypothetical protein